MTITRLIRYIDDKGQRQTRAEEIPDPRPVVDPIIPDRVTSRQFKMQLEIDGLLASVEGWVASKPKLVQIAYQNSGTFLRSEPMMQEGFAALKFDDARIDKFYADADAL